MKLNELLEELEEKEFFKEFKKENPDTFFFAGFFILDLKEKSEKISLDYFLPKSKKIASFEFPFAEPKFHEDKIESAKPQDTKLNLDLNVLEEKAIETLDKNNCKLQPTKIIAIISGDIWNLTCMDNTLGIARIKIDAKNSQTISFEKSSIFDVVKIKKS